MGSFSIAVMTHKKGYLPIYSEPRRPRAACAPVSLPFPAAGLPGQPQPVCCLGCGVGFRYSRISSSIRQDFFFLRPTQQCLERGGGEVPV